MTQDYIVHHKMFIAPSRASLQDTSDGEACLSNGHLPYNLPIHDATPREGLSRRAGDLMEFVQVMARTASAKQQDVPREQTAGRTTMVFVVDMARRRNALSPIAATRHSVKVDYVGSITSPNLTPLLNRYDQYNG